MYVGLDAVCSLQEWAVVSTGCQINVKATLILHVVSFGTPQKANVQEQNGNTDIWACNGTIKSNDGVTGALRLRERETETDFNVQCLPSSNKHALSYSYCVGAPVVHYVNIPSAPHHDYIQTPNRKWFHTQHPPQSSSLRWWMFLAIDVPDQDKGAMERMQRRGLCTRIV